MIQTETAASRFALQQIDSLSPDSRFAPEHLDFVRETLAAYLNQVENNHQPNSLFDLNRVSRLVVEYRPLSLSAGEAVVAAE